MQAIKQRFSVPYSYEVHFTERLFAPENELLADSIRGGTPGPARVLVVADSGVVDYHPGLLEEISRYADAHPRVLALASKPIIVPGGEIAKNDPDLVHGIHETIAEIGLCRHSYVMAIGGGAVLDMAGYAAATAHRGVRLIRVPTTVLSQNDSAVGVKNGVNAFGSKNFLGTFVPPHAVLNDFTFLHTLEDRDWRAGISEAFKVALLKDASFFDFLEERAFDLAPPTRDMEAMQHLIYRCAELHLEHIATSGDPFERGSSRPLDFGHWAAHRLERLTDFELRHGEAVATGIALDCTYSYLGGHLSSEACERILDAFDAIGFSLYVPELESHLADPDHPDSLFRGLAEFREHLGGELTIMLLADIGEGFEVHEVDHDLYREAIGYLRERDAVSA